MMRLACRRPPFFEVSSMKSFAKLSVFALIVVGLAGCQQDNEKEGTKDPTTGKTVTGTPPPEYQKDPKAYYRNAGKAGSPTVGKSDYNKGGSQ